MPSTANAGIKLQWERVGEPDRPALLMIMGLASSSAAWQRTLPLLTDAVSPLVFDNRGVGGSDSPRGPYSMGQMLDDTLAVMDAAGLVQAHVLGISMGGMIAQQLALRHPDRVRTLTLAATTPKGISSWPSWRFVTSLLLRPLLGPSSTYDLTAPVFYSPYTIANRPEVIAYGKEFRLQEQIPMSTVFDQLYAVRGHDVRTRLGEIGAPTLVMHGHDDGLIPQARGHELAAGIPQAEFLDLERCGHMIPAEVPKQFAAAIKRHVAG